MEELVLAVPRDALVTAGLRMGLTRSGPRAVSVLDAIERYGDFLPRSVVERNAGLLQPIPCAIMHHSLKILLLRRNERSKKNALHNRLVIWAGGHVRCEDVSNASSKGDLLLHGLMRELDEEIPFCTPTAAPDFLCLVWSRSLHFGVFYDLPVTPISNSVETNEEFAESGKGTKSGIFVDVGTLKAEFSSLETWSKVICRELLKTEEVPKPGKNMNAQLLPLLIT